MILKAKSNESVILAECNSVKVMKGDGGTPNVKVKADSGDFSILLDDWNEIAILSHNQQIDKIK